MPLLQFELRPMPSDETSLFAARCSGNEYGLGIGSGDGYGSLWGDGRGSGYGDGSGSIYGWGITQCGLNKEDDGDGRGEPDGSGKG